MIILPQKQPDSFGPNPLNTALNCCQTIEKLAGHLQQISLPETTEMTALLLVSNSGYLIAREVERLRRAIRLLHEHQAKHVSNHDAAGARP